MYTAKQKLEIAVIVILLLAGFVLVAHGDYITQAYIQ